MFLVMRLLRRTLRHPPSMMRVAVLLTAIIAYGTTGFMFFEVGARPDVRWMDALWWTLVTLTTVGYGDVAPASAEGRFIVAVPLMMFGIGLLGYVLSLAAAALIEAKNREIMGMGKMDLEGHVVIVNMPNLGKLERILEELLHASALGSGTAVVLIDEDLPQIPAALADRHVHFVRGNPARDETLARASINTATHAIVLSKRPGDPHSDDQAIAVALAIEARGNAAIRTVVECVDPTMEELLKKTGCDSIVCMSRFDAHFLGSEVVNPGAQEVADHLFSTIAGGQQLFITPIDGAARSFEDLAKACALRGHVAIGAKQKGTLQLNPLPALHLGGGDHLVSIGPTPLTLD